MRDILNAFAREMISGAKEAGIEHAVDIDDSEAVIVFTHNGTTVTLRLTAVVTKEVESNG